MRPVLFAAALALAGCGNPAEPGTGSAGPKATPRPVESTTKPPPESGPPPAGRPKTDPPRKTPAGRPEAEPSPRPDGPPLDFNDLVGEYDRQEVAADDKFKGKLGRATVRVEKVGTGADGLPFVGSTNLANEVANPNVIWKFPPGLRGEVARVEKGRRYVIEGVCAGVVHDGVPRGGFVGRYDWRVEITDCVIVGPADDER
jgi:hypothetical protein